MYNLAYCSSSTKYETLFDIIISFLVINIFLGSVLPVFHLDDSAVYVMIVYLLVLAAVVVFEIYLALVKAKDVSNYSVLSTPQDDEVELTSAPVSRTQSDIKKVRLVTSSKGILMLQSQERRG